MITPVLFEGVMSFNNFIKDFKERGHKVHFLIYLGIFLSIIFAILMIPVLLFVDLCILIYKIFEKMFVQEDTVIKGYKKRNKKK